MTQAGGKVGRALLSVSDKSGIVQLSGFVDSRAMKDKAGTVAATVRGVKDVQNVLVVKPD